ncbi:lamin tail domain-containing protein [Brachybacterium muris]|uniref:lamin tail domain-containing protein n=1 Tax=Brachybacterium muris TaxID=219301 RepID=UPI00223BAE8D|nr:lamin tail domain-containing protein [Brachybacterium muris]MCT1653411.1 lamin tail domain-containing protein [Brachybacterium muris]
MRASLRTRITPALAALALLAVPLAGMPAAEAAVVKPLDIVKIHFDPPGTDKAHNTGYNQEYIQVKNVGKTTLNLTGYKVRDDGPQVFTFPKNYKLAAGKTVTIRSGKGTNSATTLYWGKASYIWNNTGDTARTFNAAGKLLESCKYPRGGSTKTC